MIDVSLNFAAWAIVPSALGLLSCFLNPKTPHSHSIALGGVGTPSN